MEECNYPDCVAPSTYTLTLYHHGEWLRDYRYCDEHTKYIFENYSDEIKSYNRIKDKE